MKISLYIFLTLLLLSFLSSKSVFSQEERVLKFISINGNDKTKDYIILRELCYKTGDTLSIENLKDLHQQSKNNLLHTGLFNFVEITEEITDNTINIKLTVQERWYFWIYPIFEQADRNFDTYFFNKQWNRINYGLSFEKQNFLGHNQLLHLKLRFGYNEQYSIYYHIPYIDKNKNHGIWVGTDYYRNKEIAYNIKNEQYLYTNSSSSNYIFSYINTQFGYQYKIGNYTLFKSKLSYHKYQVTDSIIQLNPNYLSGTSSLQYPSIALKIIFDKTNSQVYATSGVQMALTIEQHGISDFFEPNVLNIKAHLQYHEKYLPRNYFSIETEVNYLGGFPNPIPFVLYQPLGTHQYARGLDNMVFNTEFYALCKTSLKFEFIPYHKSNIPLIPWQQFSKFHYRGFIYAFADAIYLREYGITATTGIGVDLVTYYDRVISTYVSWNNVNKKIGIFVQYKTPLIKQF